MDEPTVIGHCRLIGELQRCPHMALCKLLSTSRICDLSCCGLRADWIQIGARLGPDWTRIAPRFAANLPSEGPMQFGSNEGRAVRQNYLAESLGILGFDVLDW